MKGYAIVNGKCVSFVLSRGLAAAHKRNAGRSMSASEAIMHVEGRRREEKIVGRGTLNVEREKAPAGTLSTSTSNLQPSTTLPSPSTFNILPSTVSSLQ